MTLEKRIEVLERVNRRLRIGLCCVACILGIGLIAGAVNLQVTPNQLVAHEFDLTDSNNYVRMRLRIENGKPVMAFVDEKTNTRTQIDTQGITLYTAKQEAVAELSQAGPPEVGSLVFLSGKSKAVLEATSKGAYFELDDASGKNIFHQP